MPHVKLQSSDNEILEMDSDALRLSARLRQLAGDSDTGGSRGGGYDDAVQVPNVTAATLRRVIAWCAHHKDDAPAPEDDENRLELRGPNTWDREFLSLETTCLFELLQAASYLEVRCLADACCRAVADLMRGCSPEEIRKAFNIKCDFTPQEEEQVRQEIAWCSGPDDLT